MLVHRGEVGVFVPVAFTFPHRLASKTTEKIATVTFNSFKLVEL